jgi:hypothetical protein
LYLQVKVHLGNIPLKTSREESFSFGDADEGESFSVGVFEAEIGIIPADPGDMSLSLLK